MKNQKWELLLWNLFTVMMKWGEVEDEEEEEEEGSERRGHDRKAFWELRLWVVSRLGSVFFFSFFNLWYSSLFLLAIAQLLLACEGNLKFGNGTVHLRSSNTWRAWASITVGLKVGKNILFARFSLKNSSIILIILFIFFENMRRWKSV